MTGFYGFRDREQEKLVLVDEAEPEALGRSVLAYVSEMLPQITRGLVIQLDVVDPDEIAPGDAGERYPNVPVSRGNPLELTWGQIIGPFKSVGSDLVRGVAGDATLYGDHSWGYVLDFDANALEVYRARPVRPAGAKQGKLLEGLEMLVDFYLDKPPSEQQFLGGIAEEAGAWTR